VREKEGGSWLLLRPNGSAPVRERAGLCAAERGKGE